MQHGQLALAQAHCMCDSIQVHKEQKRLRIRVALVSKMAHHTVDNVLFAMVAERRVRIQRTDLGLPFDAQIDQVGGVQRSLNAECAASSGDAC